MKRKPKEGEILENLFQVVVVIICMVILILIGVLLGEAYIYLNEDVFKKETSCMDNFIFPEQPLNQRILIYDAKDCFFNTKEQQYWCRG